METTRLSSKGQVVLPKAVREAHDWQPGLVLAIEQTSGGVLLRPLKTTQPRKVEDVFGCLKYTGRPKTIPQMHEAVSKELKKRRGSGRY